MYKYYRIADLTIATNATPYLNENFGMFACEEVQQEADMMILFDEDPRKMFDLMQNTVDEKLVMSTSFMSIYETEEHYTIATYNDVKFVGIRIDRRKPVGVVYVNDSTVPRGANPPLNELMLTEADLYSNAFREVYMFYAQRAGRIAIHSASILYRGKGWLFSGSSGAGKSTHVKQWEAAGIPFRVIDGDIAICYRRDDAYVVAGLPWCGTSEEYSEICVPLGGIYFLEQADANEVEPMMYVDGVLHVNAEALTPNWRREQMSMTLDIAEEICRAVDIGRLKCLPNVGAAQRMQEHIDALMGEVSR